MKTVLLPKYFVTYHVNMYDAGYAPLPKFMEVTENFVRVYVDPADQGLAKIASNAAFSSQSSNSVVRKSARRTVDRLVLAGYPMHSMV